MIEIKEKAKSLHGDSVKLLSALIAAGSIDGGTSGKEGARGKIIEQELKTLTDRVCTDTFGNICAAIGESKNPQTIVWFIGHFDTVAPGEWLQAYEPKLDGNKLYGRGSSDQLSGIVSSITAMKMLKEQEQQLTEKGIRFVVIANPHEEDCEGESIKYLLKNIMNTSREYADWMQQLPHIIVTTEPTSTQEGIPRPYFGHRGRYLYQMKVEGETGHASIPVTISAAQVFSKIVDNIFENVVGPDSLKFGLDTYAFTTGKLTSPSENAHTEIAAWDIDFRIAPTSDPKYILEKMKEIARKATAEIAKKKSLSIEEMPKVAFSVVKSEYETYHGYKFVGLQQLPGLWLSPFHPLHKRVMNVYNEMFGTPPYDQKSINNIDQSLIKEEEGDYTIRDYYNFSTDLTGLAQMIRQAQKEGKEVPPIAYFGLGSGIEEKAHRKDEYCPVNSLDHAAAYYVAFIQSYLSD